MAFAKQTDVDKVVAQSEVNRLMKLDTKAWYKKPNLRRLYFFLVPAVLGVEMTSGYDGSILNGLQAVGPWLTCEPLFFILLFHADLVDFGNPQGAVLGVINAAFSIGAVMALPVVPYVGSVPLGCRAECLRLTAM